MRAKKKERFFLGGGRESPPTTVWGQTVQSNLGDKETENEDKQGKSISPLSMKGGKMSSRQVDRGRKTNRQQTSSSRGEGESAITSNLSEYPRNEVSVKKKNKNTAFCG